MGQRIARLRKAECGESSTPRNPPQTPIEKVVESNDNWSAKRSLSEVKSSSRSLVEDQQKDPTDDEKCESSGSGHKFHQSLSSSRAEIKPSEEDHIQDIQQVDEASVSDERSQRSPEDKDQDDQYFKDWDVKSLNLSTCLEDFRLSGLSLKDERHEAEEHISEIHRPDKEVQEEQNFKATDQKTNRISTCLEDFRLSDFSLNEERHEAEEHISEIHRPEKEEEDQDEQEVQEFVRNISKEKWKKCLIANTQDVYSYYKIGKQLGEGSFGCVYEAERLSDGLKVALKYVDKTPDVEYMRIPGHRKSLPTEVAIMMIMQKHFIIPQIIQLLEWFDKPDRYILVLERPANSENLRAFTDRSGGRVDENTARIIMRQVLEAAQECCKRGVFHRDIKLENLLVNRKTLQVKLIDFGCSIRLKRGYEKSIVGTEMYLPPEAYISDKYRGKPVTVWSLGMLLFRMVNGRFPFAYELHKMYDASWIDPEFSYELCRLMRYSLQFKDKERVRLKKMHKHDWFQMVPQNPLGKDK